MIVTFAVFESPLDYPGEFVVREFVSVNGQVLANAKLHSRGESLEEVRETIPAGKFRLPRHPRDVLSLVETWF